MKDKILKCTFVLVLILTFSSSSNAEEGKWVKSGGFIQLNIACTQPWACGPKTQILHGSDTVMERTGNEMTTGICSADGGAADSCNMCLSAEPKIKCEWKLISKKNKQ